MSEKLVWLKRDVEWIKNNPGKPTMYKGILNVEDSYFGNSLLKKAKSEKIKEINDSGLDFADPGVYLIINELSNRVYVGQSINMYSRLRNHKHYIDGKAISKNRVYVKMAEDRVKHGINSFQFLRYVLMPGKELEDLLCMENDVMHEFRIKGYDLYNIDVSFGNVYCPPAYKDKINEIISIIVKYPEKLNDISNLLSGLI